MKERQEVQWGEHKKCFGNIPIYLISVKVLFKIDKKFSGASKHHEDRLIRAMSIIPRRKKVKRKR
jgi:hypothetical protein